MPDAERFDWRPLTRQTGTDPTLRYFVGTHDLHCGEPLALLFHNRNASGTIDTIVLRGRVEADDEGWYFIGANGDTLALRTGMTAAIPETRMGRLGPTWRE